jgi:ElaB/YqjD/DUF883 family membrane-anchored ribosome-binding protein
MSGKNFMTFDSHTYIKELLAAGFSEQQAEAQAKMLNAFVESSFISKRDLQEVESTLSSNLRQVETALANLQKLEGLLKQDFEGLSRDLKQTLEVLQAETRTELEHFRAASSEVINHAQEQITKTVTEVRQSMLRMVETHEQIVDSDYISLRKSDLAKWLIALFVVQAVVVVVALLR